MKRLSIVLVASAAFMALSAGVASAHKVHFDSTVTINFTDDPYYGDTFFGQVNSADKPACQKNRTVKVKREEGDDDPVFGTDVTDDDGDYSVTTGAPAPAGSYYAKAKKLFLKKNKHHKHICDSAKSSNITVP